MPGPTLVASLGVLAFAAVIFKIGLVRKARLALTVARDGVAALTNPALDDDEKEKAVQKAGLRLLGLTGALVWRFVLILAAAAVPMYLADLAGLVPFDASMGRLLNGWFVLGSTVVMIVVVWVALKVTGGSKRGQETGKDRGESYSGTEQIMHMIAFLPGLQRALMRLDNRMFRRRHAEKAPRVILVTSIARGGTTACLNAIYSLPQVGTNTYRDMPFITAPWLWNRLSSLMGRKTERRERAHGDGMEIDLDSPEAFDEVTWKLLWPGKYGADGIALWRAEDADADCGALLRINIEKIAILRGNAEVYVSKNNANLGRLEALPRLFPDCYIVVPLRDPAAHAASLLRQHRNFVAQQSEDSFVKRYMEDIGHFEFGLVHRPILFPGFDATAFPLDSPDYWLAYWIAAFRHVEAQLPSQGTRLRLVTQDDLRTAPDATLKAILAETGVSWPPGTDFSGFFRPGADRTDETVFIPELLAEAKELYTTLAGQRSAA
ncbi:sulfotransferase [Alloyangia pacifica]|uniref:sulfotransferase n=1 Tax=Alloyangia pacifica TaxID=311180 RepID=UPI001CD24CB0|nr:sulfotransferase [Alloyangia pacifica]MCA0998771.1 sulfotransferase [Alloyangia pacifica]